MGKTRSMLRKKKYDEACSRISSNSGVAPWSDLTHDVLSLVMMKLGVVDFLAFSRVCKSWRSLALSNKNKFIVSRPPMSISVSTDANENECYLKDFEGRKLKTIVPHSSKRRCIGVTCGYLILLGEKRKDFWLVNLITRHELHFPDVPREYFCCPGNRGPILVFSPSISGWVLVVVTTCYNNKIWFSIAGKRKWNYVSSPFPINDLHAFKGKIYTLVHSLYGSDEVRLCEMKVYPEPKLVLLETKNFLKPNFTYPGFVSSGENLYVIDVVSEHPYKIHEIDIDEMKWVSREKKGEEYSFFLMKFKSDYLPPQHGRYVVSDKNGKGRSFYAKLWYLFFDCLKVDLIHG